MVLGCWLCSEQVFLSPATWSYPAFDTLVLFLSLLLLPGCLICLRLLLLNSHPTFKSPLPPRSSVMPSSGPIKDKKSYFLKKSGWSVLIIASCTLHL